jgi:4-amino-4-deoxy-L-arabinose transferase-like glycosyltransferase
MNSLPQRSLRPDGVPTVPTQPMSFAGDGAALAFLVVLTLASTCALLTQYPAPGGDEDGFVEVAYNLLTRGTTAAPAYEGLLPGAEQQMSWQPPLYFVALAGWMAVAGTDLASIRFFSVLAALGIVACAYLLARQYAPLGPSLLGSSLLAISHWLVIRGRSARMDALCILLTVATILFWHRAVSTGRRAYGIAGGVGAALAVLTHPLGAIAITVLMLDVVLARRTAALRDSLTWCMVVAFLFTVVVPILIAAPDYDTLRAQMALQLLRKYDLGSYWTQFWIAKSHVITLTVVLSGSLWMVVRRGNEARLPAVALAVSFAAATIGRESGYFAYFFPFACIALSISVGRERPGMLIAAALGLSLANEAGMLAYDVYRYRHRNYSELTGVVHAAIPPGRTVFLGHPAVSPYFALLGRNPVRIAVPTRTEPTDAHRLVAESCDYIAVTRPVPYLPDVAAIVKDAAPIAIVDQGPGYRLELFARPR